MGTLRFSFTGGEPLLRNDTGDIVKFAKNLGSSVSIISNGALIPKKIEILRLVDDVCISLDGTKEVMDANRVPGAFQYAVQACKILKEEGIPFHLNCVLTKNNAKVEIVRFLLDFAKQHGTRCAFLVMQTVPETSGDVTFLYAQRDAILECLNEIIAAHSRGEPILFWKKSYELTFKWSDFSKPRIYTKELDGQGYPTCRAGLFFCNVDTNGFIFPCCLTIGEIPGENA